MDSTVGELDLTFARAIEGAESDAVAIETLSCIVGPNQMLAKRLADKIGVRLHSHQPAEVMNVLDVLEICMNDNEIFRHEIGRFKFLNEFVKLISPSRAIRPAPEAVRDRIMDLMLVWTRQYPAIHKIKEAYEMLLKQGVPHEASKDHRIDRSCGGQLNVARRPANEASTQFDDIPKHLWTSTDPADVQAVNLMVEKALEKGKRLDELRLKYAAELKEATELSAVLTELLDVYSSGDSSEDDSALISEMFEQCRAMQICISRYAVDPNNTDLATSLATNDRLQEVMQRYQSVVVEGKRNNQCPESSASPKLNSDLLMSLLGSSPAAKSDAPLNIPLLDPLSDNLDDIFLTPIQAVSAQNSHQPATDLLRFTNDQPVVTNPIMTPTLTPSILDKIEPKKPAAVPNKDISKLSHSGDFFGLDSTISGLKISLVQNDKVTEVKSAEKVPDLEPDPLPAAEDPTDTLLDMNPSETSEPESTFVPEQLVQSPETPLAELVVDLDHIRPSSHPAKVILDETNGLKVVLNFALDRPRSDVAVIVVTTTNHSREAVSRFELEASVTKPCKVRLLPASGTGLPGVKPFRPPTDDITQLLLVANKERVAPLRITCIVSYCLGDDPDPIKESIIIDDLPVLH